jgi:acyl-coenzyme A synthetase/AMP-(fatty) acid ligase
MFDDYIRNHAYWTPRAPAVVTPRRRYSYAEFNADIDRFGAGLTRLGVTREAGVVAVRLEKAYMACVATAALCRLRIASAAFDDPRADVRLVDQPPAPAEAGPRAVMLDEDWLAAVRAAPPTPLPLVDVDPEGVGRVMLSSGTTREPRRIAMSWRAMEAVTLANVCTRGGGRTGVWIPLTTLGSMQGFSLAMAAWSLGATITGAVSVADVPAMMETLAPGLIGATPRHLRNLLAALPPDFRPMPQWRINVGGSRLSPALAREARLRLTPDLWVSYGSTEAPAIALGLGAGLDEDPGLMGVAQPGMTVAILDDEGRPVPEGDSGELRVRGPRVATGYLGDPEATAERFREGWFLTRDIGRRLPDGRIILEGRVDDRMNLGGVKFMPTVLEDAALACPGVVDCAAFAVPDEEGLDACWLAVSVAPGFDRADLAPHLAKYPGLPPPRFAWIDEIPRNPMGKIERTRLREAVMTAIGRAG